MIILSFFELKTLIPLVLVDKMLILTCLNKHSIRKHREKPKLLHTHTHTHTYIYNEHYDLYLFIYLFVALSRICVHSVSDQSIDPRPHTNEIAKKKIPLNRF